MKIVITDFPKVLNRNLPYEIALLEKELPDCEVSIVPFESMQQWMSEIRDADAMLTAFLTMDDTVMAQLPKLKCISINASGFNTISMEAAARRGIGVAAIQEYCTQEVAEHALTLMLTLSRGIKHYEHDIDVEKKWQYTTLTGVRRIEGQTLGICGYGKIGSAVAARAKAFGMKIIAYSPYTTEEQAKEAGITLVDKDTLLRESDIITNHMAQTAENYHFFDQEAFGKMDKKPIFINVARGLAMDEKALERALDEGLVRGAGLDVLESENPKLEECGLIQRENVIITPHSAFYSEDSLRALQDISCMNLVHYLRREYDQIHWLVNGKELLKK